MAIGQAVDLLYSLLFSLLHNNVMLCGDVKT